MSEPRDGTIGTTSTADRDGETTGLLLRHAALPALAPLALIVLSFTPLTVVSCRDKGLLALVTTGASAVAAFICIGFAFRDRARDRASAMWWILSAAILALSLALLIGPLG